MNYKDYYAPVFFALISLILSLIFQKNISSALLHNSFSNEIFTVSTLLFGLTLTSYSILFGILPSIKEDLRTSKTMKDINLFFRSCLLILLVEIILAVIYLFYLPYWIFVLNLIFLGTSIGFFYETIFLINDIFNEVTR